MFTDFFFLLRFYGVPVTVTEWLALMRGLAMGLVPTGLDEFYAVARSILVKSEAYFDQYDQAFAAMFKGIETPVEIDDEVWDWLSDPLDDARAERRGAPAAGRRARGPRPGGAPAACSRSASRSRPRPTTAATSWVGTGGTSPFGHSGFHPGGIRVGGESRNRQRRQGGRRAPLPRLPHRPGGRRAAVRARPATPSPALVAQRRRPRRARPRRDRRGDGEQRRPPQPRLAQEPQERRQGAAAHGRRRLHAPLHPPLQPALQRRQPQHATSRTCASTTSTTASTTGSTRARA